MKRIIVIVAAIILSVIAMAQDLSQFKVLSDSLFLTNDVYATGNKYQRDAMLFVDMLADTHPYYIKKERRDILFAGQEKLLSECAACQSDSAFVELLIKALGDLHDKHTDVIDLTQLQAKRQAKQQQEELQSREQRAESGASIDSAESSEKKTGHQPADTDALMANKGDLFHYVILPEHNLCYLQFNQCADSRTTGNESFPRWDTMIEEMFAKMKVAGIKRLVVDAQYNNGGSSMLCDELLIRLCPYEKLQTYSTSMRFSGLMAAFNPRIAVAKQSWEADGHIDELYPMPKGKVGSGFVQPEVFDGKVIFVQSEKTYSSAAILMTLARDNHIGRIVGEESSFSPSHYGEILPYRLPNTGVIGTISCKFFARPDLEHLYDKTLQPDVFVDLSDKAKALQDILKLFE